MTRRHLLRAATIPLVLALSVALTSVAGSVESQAAEPDRADVRSAEWWLSRWGLEQAWHSSMGRGIVVAVLDGGVQSGIQELRGSVLPGLDLVAGGTDGRSDLDRGSHGTRVAVLIAGRLMAGTAMVGVAPKASVLPVVLGRDGEFPDAGGLQSAKAIRWSVDHGARVINMSYAGDEVEGCPRALQEAVLYALARDVVLVAGAGNDGDGANLPTVPALCAGVVAVGAVDRDGRPWARTQRQEYVDLAGPGVDIVSVNRAGEVGASNGTSDAAALVSGVVALVRGRFPRMPGREVVRRLLATARDAGAPGRDDRTGYGIVRPLEALTADVPATAGNPVYEEVDRLRGVAPPAGGRVGVIATSYRGVVVGAAGLVVVAVGVVLGIRRRTRWRVVRRRGG